jgi:hypothetical protein
MTKIPVPARCTRGCGSRTRSATDPARRWTVGLPTRRASAASRRSSSLVSSQPCRVKPELTSLAGLLLWYIGSTSTAYRDRTPSLSQSTVRAPCRRGLPMLTVAWRGVGVQIVLNEALPSEVLFAFVVTDSEGEPILDPSLIRHATLHTHSGFLTSLWCVQLAAAADSSEPERERGNHPRAAAHALRLRAACHHTMAGGTLGTTFCSARRSFTSVRSGRWCVRWTRRASGRLCVFKAASCRRSSSSPRFAGQSCTDTGLCSYCVDVLADDSHSLRCGRA